MKKKNIFKKLIGLEGKRRWRVQPSKTLDSERWINHVLTADADAPNIEVEKRNYYFLVFFGLTLLIFTLILGKLFDLQIVKGKSNYNSAEINRLKERVVRAPRGILYDSTGTPLVKNVPNYDLVITPSNLPMKQEERDRVIKNLSKIINKSESEIIKAFVEKGIGYSQPVLISKNLSKDTAIIVDSQIKELRGISVEVNPIREYLDGGLLSHALGYVGRISEDEIKNNKDYLLTDYIGKSGIEKTYERQLRGVNGKERTEVNSKGQNEKILGLTEPIPGDSIRLSIDLDLQRNLTEDLQKQMIKSKVGKASAIAINPNTGKIIALVSLPSYDNNLFAKGISSADYDKLLKSNEQPLISRSIGGEYPSGSSIKPFIAAAALEEGTITESTTVNSTGGFKVGEFSFPDWKAGGHGVTNVVKAIAESVNTFFYAIGGGHQNINGLGPEKMKTYLEKFGFANYTGIDVLGEAKGSVPDPEWKERIKAEPWYLGDTYHMAIGQGDILVTPLQIANATAAIANGGTLYKPRIADYILDQNGKEKNQILPEINKKNILSEKSLSIVRAGMRQTVTSGSGSALKNLPGEVAGKTGTAQYGPNNSKQHAWFTSFAPYNKPTVVLTILVEGAGGGDVFAVPVASDFYKYYFSR